MSSTEPPSRVPPRQQPHESKAAREELSSKGKVEKVREVDPDEETRKQRFLKYYKGNEEEGAQEERPSPFDLYSGKPMVGKEGSFKGVDNAIVPGQANTPPPNVQSTPPSSSAEEEGDEGAQLPQSEDFWGGFDLPDQPLSSRTNFQETPGLAKTAEGKTETPPSKGKESVSEHKKRIQEIEKKEKEVLFTQGKVEKKKEGHKTFEKKKNIQEPSPFGPPGKLSPSKREEKEPLAAPFLEEKKQRTPAESLPLKKEAAKEAPRTFLEKQMPSEEESQAVSQTLPPKIKEKQTLKEKEDAAPAIQQGIGALPIKAEEREGGQQKEKKKEETILEIDAPSSTKIPSHLEPMAMVATTQAAPYLSAGTVSLFYQMVGTMYVMAGPQGINRTEIILNNPNFANSKFYGSTIIVEKYATAPDSFNIRLTGSHEAVSSFRQNIPSLLAAFQNGNFSFRVNRLDVEYTMERPLFRRKEKGEEKGEAGGGDLGERRNG